jgi:hypothetical protein
MKRISIILTIGLAFLPGLIKAQNPNRERLDAYKIAFITRRLDLTPDEAEKFWPVYNEFQDKKVQIQKERGQLNRKFNQEGNTMTEKELSEAGDTFIDLEVKEAELSLAFHKQLKSILPPVKILRLYQAENQYRQQLLNQLQQRNQQQRNNPDQPKPLPPRN